MANIQRIRIALTGFPGGPGVTTFYATDAAAALPELKGLCADFAVFMPSNVFFTYPTSGDIIDPLDGSLVSTWTAPARAGDAGGSATTYAAPTGVCINWSTGTVLDGHRLSGRTFFVPCVASIYDIDGTIYATQLAAMRTAASTHQGVLSSNFVVWHRPREASVLHPVARAGGYSAVTGSSVPDKAVILRSRRD